MKPEPFPSAASRGQLLADSAAETLTTLSADTRTLSIQYALAGGESQYR